MSEQKIAGRGTYDDSLSIWVQRGADDAIVLHPVCGAWMADAVRTATVFVARHAVPVVLVFNDVEHPVRPGDSWETVLECVRYRQNWVHAVRRGNIPVEYL